jgi:hypothetical protein
MAERTLYRFEDFEATRNAAAAVMGRLVRGDDVMHVADGLVASGDLVGPDEVTARPAAEVEQLADQQLSRAQRRRIEQMARKEAKRVSRAA